MYTAIGVPVLALIFAMVTNFALVSRVEKRVDELRDTLRAEINGTRDMLRAEINSTWDLLRAEIAASEAKTATIFADLRMLIEKNHSEMMLKFVELDHRLSRTENERRIVG